MRLSEFKWEQVSFQADYATAFPLWDSAGQVWHRLSEMFEGLTIENAAPAQVVGMFGTSRIAVEMQKTSWIILQPDEFDEDTLCSKARGLFDVVAQKLEVKEFSRIGCRTQWSRKYDTVDDASAAFTSLGLINIPTGAHFGLKDPKRGPMDYRVTQTGKSLAITTMIKTEERLTKIVPPFGAFEIEAKELRSHRLALDVDFFTLAPMLRSQLDMSTWLSGALRVIRRDIRKFIGDQ